MSLGVHRLWKKRYVEIVNPVVGDKILDVGSGSGDITLELLKKNINIYVDLIDLNNQMLDIGKTRTGNPKVKKMCFGKNSSKYRKFCCSSNFFTPTRKYNKRSLIN